MDIEDFYDGDPRRRSGEDHSYGLNWSVAAEPHRRFDLYWNDGTGELYLMGKPVPDPLVGWVGVALVDDWRELEAVEHRIVAEAEHLIHPRQIQAKTGEASARHSKEHLTEQLTVEILGTIENEDAVDQVLDGWQEAMNEPDSVSWVRSRLSEEEVQA
ncbi:MAG TPA: hypothetical protein VKY26_03985 [Actinomycetota bacterium]|nr:hypothetical protein [Actinomycetota bacterium]